MKIEDLKRAAEAQIKLIETPDERIEEQAIKNLARTINEMSDSEYSQFLGYVGNRGFGYCFKAITRREALELA